SDAGYAFANINSIPDIDQEKRQVTITFFVDPGKRVYVRRINISGNTQTKDEVVRRELRQMESAWFSGEKVRLSRERLQRLGYFGDVNIETPAVAGLTDQLDVDIDVEEKASGSLSAGIGFSQTQGFLFNASITQENFIGTGKRVSAGFDTSKANRRLVLAYTNPYYTINGISRGFELSFRETDFAELNISSYTTDVSRLGMNFGIPVTEFDRLRFSLAYEDTQFFLGSSPPQEIIDFEEENGDHFIDYEFLTSWIRDNRDRAIFPNRGAKQILTLETNLPSSDLQYYRVSYRHTRYFSLTKSIIFKLNADLGYGDGYGEDEELPFFRNFYAGGIGTVRGFEGNSLGPQDEFDNALGANAKITGQMELLFPPPGDTFEDSMRFGLFLDAGNVFDVSGGEEITAEAFRASGGVMLSWMSPVGPLSFSLGYPLKSRDEDKLELFQFTIGAGF
ncbi:MAG: outer membrane protein assembly factor BamA, partial [Pseudomonadota bacterium]